MYFLQLILPVVVLLIIMSDFEHFDEEYEELERALAHEVLMDFEVEDAVNESEISHSVSEPSPVQTPQTSRNVSIRDRAVMRIQDKMKLTGERLTERILDEFDDFVESKSIVYAALEEARQLLPTFLDGSRHFIRNLDLRVRFLIAG